MIGYGGGQGETWGLNTVTGTNLDVLVNGYVTTDFVAAFGTTTVGHGANTASVTNNFRFITGDSGGGAFIYDTSAAKWKLAGLNEAVDAQNNGYLVQLSDYASAINDITSVPESSTGAVLAAGVLAFVRRRHLPRHQRRSAPSL
jgi:hypothetical protein